MAKPQTEDGWTPYAHELDAALAAADFSKGARIVLREVFSQTFGLAKNKTAFLSPSEIGGRVGVMKEHLVKSIAMLVECNVLRRVGRGEYRFVKDYERWTFPDGSRRLTKTEISWCLNAPYVAKAHAKPRKTVLNTGAQLVPEDESLGAQLVPENGNLGSAVGSQNGDSHYRNAPAELEIREGLEGVVLPDNQGAGAGTRTGKPVSIKDLILEAKALHGEDVARQVMAGSQEILGTFGDDRLDCYLAAIREAVNATATIQKPHRWFLRVGKRHLAGDVDPPAQIPPRRSKQAEASRKQAEATAEILADPDFNRWCDEIEGA